MADNAAVWHVYTRAHIMFLASPEQTRKRNTTHLAWLAAMGMADTLEILGCQVICDG